MKKTIILSVLFCISTISHAQFHYEIPQTQKQQIKKTMPQKKQGFVFDKSKLTFGGALGLQFGDYTLVNIAPQVGYNFSQYFNAGFGFTYTYWKDDYWSGSNKFKESNSYLGFNLYGRFYPIQNIVLLVQPEINRAWQTIEVNSREKIKDEKFVPACLVGGGLRLGSMMALIQYDVVQNERSPYGNNIFYSIGYTFSF